MLWFSLKHSLISMSSVVETSNVAETRMKRMKADIPVCGCTPSMICSQLREYFALTLYQQEVGRGIHTILSLVDTIHSWGMEFVGLDLKSRPENEMHIQNSKICAMLHRLKSSWF